jgi:hypothetical protein
MENSPKIHFVLSISKKSQRVSHLSLHVAQWTALLLPAPKENFIMHLE